MDELKLNVFQDNQSTSRIAWTGKAPTLRHIKRTHAISIKWIHERVRSEAIILTDCHTHAQAADIFTKHFTDKTAWTHHSRLIGVVQKDIWKRFKPIKKKSAVPAAPALFIHHSGRRHAGFAWP